MCDLNYSISAENIASYIETDILPILKGTKGVFDRITQHKCTVYNKTYHFYVIKENIFVPNGGINLKDIENDILAMLCRMCYDDTIKFKGFRLLVQPGFDTHFWDGEREEDRKYIKDISIVDLDRPNSDSINTSIGEFLSRHIFIEVKMEIGFEIPVKNK